MTQFPHDQFAKDYLEELLAPFGKVQAPRRVPGEVQSIDVWFDPARSKASRLETLGLLGRLAETPSLFEPFRNAATISDICTCLSKLLILRGELQRQANRRKESLVEKHLPRLWILSPTASDSILNGFRVKVDIDQWGEGIYLFGEYLRTAIIAIHHLPKTDDTLWLRLLGRGRVQSQAIEQLKTFSSQHPLRSNVLRLFANLQANLKTQEQLNQEDRDLVMQLSPLYIQWREEALQEGKQRTMNLMVESMLETKFGSLDAALQQIVEPLSQLSAKECTQLIWQSSREALLERFRETT